MSISEVAIRKPVFAWMLMAALILFGGLTFFRMGISQLPDVDFPVINIALSLNNAAPEVMENDVVDPIEDAVMGIEGIRTVTSNCSQGAANVTVEFELGRNVDVALQEVQTRIEQAKRQLPLQLDPPVITKTNPEDQPILWVMITADQSIPLYQQMMYARNTLKDRFSTVAGVGNIQFGGYVDPNLRVSLSNEKLKNYDLSADDVISAITAEQLELPAGRIENPQKEYNVRLLGEAATPDEFGKIRINQRAGAPNYRPLPIKEVARVEEGLADIRALSRYNGAKAVGLGIVKQRGSNAVAVAEAVKERVKLIRPSLPKGYNVDVRLDSTKFIKESVGDLNFTLLLSAILTSVVCLIFLASWSSTINVLFSIPTSIVGAFTFLYFFGFTLNTFTLLGLSLAIGIVVDDAIMMLENIVRHQEMGQSRMKAAIEGSKEITFAALAATIAIAAIFLPVVFMKGVIGKFFFQFGITVTVAVFLSLLEALTLTPMRCSQIGSHDPHSRTGYMGKLAEFMDRQTAKWATEYKKILRYCLANRGLVMAATLGFFVISMLVLIPLRKELMPEQDQSQFLISIKAPVGTAIPATDQIFQKAEEYLKKQPEVAEYYSSIGGYQGQDIVNAGTIFVTLKDPSERELNQGQFMRKARRELGELLTGVEVFAQDLSLSGFSSSRGFPVEFTVQGPDWKKILDYTHEIMDHLKKDGLATDINTDVQDDMPEIQIIPNRDQLADHGVSISSMGNAVSTMVGGYTYDSATQYPKDGHRYNILVRSEEKDHSQPEDILDVSVHNNRGANTELVPLKKVATIEKTKSLALITRMNRIRAIPVYANVKEGQSQQAVLDSIEQYGKKILPAGYRLTITGTAQTFRESFQGLVFALILGIIVSYMVLASQFNSFIHPVTVLMALPFSLSGAFVSLFIFHQSINLFSMIGLILLMGIVKKNSILLVDFTNAKRAEGLPPLEALLEACPVRLRPILMTSFATIAGAVPAALSIGPGSETRIPMAISIIGGVLVSTFLTLFVVPCAYSLLTKWERKSATDEEIDQVFAHQREVQHT
jgi:HAE1 family hydrophobic/amphiphilic exporter-1